METNQEQEEQDSKEQSMGQNMEQFIEQGIEEAQVLTKLLENFLSKKRTHPISKTKNSKEVKQIQKKFSKKHPVDLAQVLSELPKDLQEDGFSLFFSLFGSEISSQILVESNFSIRYSLLERLTVERLYSLLQHLDSAEGVELLSLLDSEKRHEILRQMDRHKSRLWKELFAHKKETAGRIMTKEIFSVSENSNVGEVIQELRIRGEKLRSIYTVFIINSKNQLVGLLSLKKLILNESHKRMQEIMNLHPISVPTGMDQEEVVQIAKRYNLVSLPVVNEKGILKGRITFDDLMDVMQEESSEDLHKVAGITEESTDPSDPFWKKPTERWDSFRRLPWLIMGLGGGTVAAFIVSNFVESLTRIVALSFFTPILLSMAGNIAIQSAAIMVSGLAQGKIVLSNKIRAILQELKNSLLNALICSLIFFLISILWQDWKLGIFLSVSLFVIMSISAFVGACIPLILKKWNIDPAIAMGPFITISTDLLGLLIYFSLASYFILGTSAPL